MGTAQVRGLVIGLVLGIVWMWLGFGAALLVAALGLLGWFVGSAVGTIASGNVSLEDIWNDLQGRRRVES